MTRNLGYRRTGEAWLREALSGDPRPDLVFAQEVLPGLLSTPPEGYLLVAGRAETAMSPVGRTSVLLIREGLGDVDEGAEAEDRPFSALGTYAATARLRRADGWVWLVSAHASPSPVPPDKRQPAYGVRGCEAHPWWADVFLAEVQRFSSDRVGHAVVAGDINEALAYDERNGHVCGRQLLKGIADTGFVDVTDRDWGHIERPTRLNPDYQLDRVFASPTAAEHVSVGDAELVHDDASDHAALWFTMTF